jgi:esterase/lipase
MKNLFMTLLIVAGVGTPLFSARAQTKPALLQEPVQVLPASGPVANGVTLLVHGLNTHPQKLVALADYLQKQGETVVYVTLQGHLKGQGPESLQEINRGTWLEDVNEGYKRARALADQDQLLLTYVGYGLGGLLGVDLLQDENHKEVHWDNMILLAPAVATDFWTTMGLKMLRILNTNPRNLLKADGPADFTLRSQIPVAAENALYKSQRLVWSRDGSRLQIPTLIFVDPKDEYVSESGLRSFIGSRHLNAIWNLQEVTKDGSAASTFHHDLLDENSLGVSKFETLSAGIENFLKSQVDSTP